MKKETKTINNETPKASPAEGFGTALEQKNIIPHTIRRHLREVKRYEKWLKENYSITAEDCSQNFLLQYLQHIKEKRNLCNATQNQLLQILKNYYSYLSQSEGITNITAFIKIRGTKRKLLHYLFTPDELDELCDSYYHFIRNYIPSNKELHFYPQHEQLLQGRYIALTLMAYQALQVNEIENLCKDDFDLRKGTVKVQSSLKGAERKILLVPLQIGILIQYYNDGDAPLVPNRNHFEKLNDSLKTLSSKYKDFRQLRASKITHWLKLHGLRKAQYLAGHKNIQSTETYLAGELETLQSDMENFHPLR